jgi:hypothetical protein
MLYQRAGRVPINQPSVASHKTANDRVKRTIWRIADLQQPSRESEILLLPNELECVGVGVPQNR